MKSGMPVTDGKTNSSLLPFHHFSSNSLLILMLVFASCFPRWKKKMLFIVLKGREKCV